MCPNILYASENYPYSRQLYLFEIEPTCLETDQDFVKTNMGPRKPSSMSSGYIRGHRMYKMVPMNKLQSRYNLRSDNKKHIHVSRACIGDNPVSIP
jgi:hypothetical protein